MDRELIAIHEAGHAVAAHIVGHPVDRVTMHGAWVAFDRSVLKEVRLAAVVNWGGPLAQHHFRPTSLAQRRLLWEREWSGDRRNLLRVDARVRRQERWRADRIVVGNWPAIVAVAEALIVKRMLSGDDIAILVERAPTACLPDTLLKAPPARPSWLDFEPPGNPESEPAVKFQIL